MKLLGFSRSALSFVPFRHSRLCLTAALMTAISVSPVSAPAQPDYQLHATPVTAAPADPAIAAALAQVSDARIRQTIEKLVGFGTRDTISSMETDLPPGQ